MPHKTYENEPDRWCLTCNGVGILPPHSGIGKCFTCNGTGVQPASLLCEHKAVVKATGKCHSCGKQLLARTFPQEVEAERDRQNKKWGEQNHPDGTDPDTDPLERILEPGWNNATDLATNATNVTDSGLKDGTVTFQDIFLEEVFEAIAEEDEEKLYTELVQVAAVAQQWAEAIRRRQNNR
jgi:hypothetical protein